MEAHRARAAGGWSWESGWGRAGGQWRLAMGMSGRGSRLRIS
jgi:hypothetical protein